MAAKSTSHKLPKRKLSECDAVLGTNSLDDKTYAYDSGATTTVMFTNSAVFTNSNTANCAVTSCTLKASDCTADMPAAISSYITVDGSDYSIKISQTSSAGYALTAFCISCTNGAQTETKTINVKQTKDCSTSTLTDVASDVSIDYGASSSLLALSGYAAASNFFTYADTTDCGALTCELKAAGCSSSWSDTSDVSMDASTYAVSVKQNEAAGQVKTLCVKC